ncbi:hypothetical protein WT08_00265 [Burkholderia sp. MSMB1552]|nr:hypothetical protein WT08_00265 [Burkholderia sp. MSMB1552]KWZ50483.1 hypothetical protein WS92_24135 [Burkholderia sp. MSMB1588]
MTSVSRVAVSPNNHGIVIGSHFDITAFTEGFVKTAALLRRLRTIYRPAIVKRVDHITTLFLNSGDSFLRSRCARLRL